jgi:small subunit ribosomal protein S9
MPKDKYIYAVGRRKKAIARIRLFKTKGESLINDKPVNKYFPGSLGQLAINTLFETCNIAPDKYHATVKVVGSGPRSQLDAVIHGLARSLVKIDAEKYKPMLKKKGYLTRDPRKKERRKVGTGGKARRQKQSPKR